MGGTDWVKEHPTFQDMNDTNDVIANGITETIVDTALTSGATNTFTFPTRRNWTKIKLMWTLTNASGSGVSSIDLLRINGKSGATDYKQIINTKNSTTINSVSTSELVCRNSSYFAELGGNGSGVSVLQLELVNDKIIFKGESGDYISTSRWDETLGIVDTTETKISSISFVVNANVSGRIKVLGEESN